MKNTVDTIAKTCSTCGYVVGLISFPVLTAVTYWFFAYELTRLSSSTQNAIENGTPGMLLGYFGGTLLIGTACAMWQSLENYGKQWKSSKSS